MAGEFELVEPAAGELVVRLDGRDQSHLDLRDPTRLAFDYVRRIGDVLDARRPAGAPLLRGRKKKPPAVGLGVSG